MTYNLYKPHLHNFVLQVNFTEHHKHQKIIIMTKNNRSSSKEATTHARLRRDKNGVLVSPSEVEFHSIRETLEQERQERGRIVLWRQPLLTLQYFLWELLELFFVLSSR